ncbi:phasin family protein [Aquisalimonas sp.]|uniref:phasin family protein n=1 Tax=Aquisalimonas sp. TaxID=1872621 RepID=UPI0025BCDE03|nr:phasin family protein [Aquisalimonas sp.]
MKNPSINQVNEQFEKFFGGPARAFAELSIDHMESLVNNQVEASKVYTDLGIKQIRKALDVKAPQDLQSYLQSQQEVVKELTERVRSDSEKVVALNRRFAEDAQKLTQQKVKAASEEAQQLTQENVKAVSEQAQQLTQESTKAAAKATPKAE